MDIRLNTFSKRVIIHGDFKKSSEKVLRTHLDAVPSCCSLLTFFIILMCGMNVMIFLINNV